MWSYYRVEIDTVDDNTSHGKSYHQNARTEKQPPQLPRPAEPPQSSDGSQPPRSSGPSQPPQPIVNVEITNPLKCFSNFWRSLDLPLINCELELDLSWIKDCVLLKHNYLTGVNFMINSTKVYVPVVTLSINNSIRFLENIKQEFKETIS